MFIFQYSVRGVCTRSETARVAQGEREEIFLFIVSFVVLYVTPWDHFSLFDRRIHSLIYIYGYFIDIGRLLTYKLVEQGYTLD